MSCQKELVPRLGDTGHAVNTGVYDQELADTDAIVDGLFREPDPYELRSRDEAVLTTRDDCDPFGQSLGQFVPDRSRGRIAIESATTDTVLFGEPYP